MFENQFVSFKRKEELTPCGVAMPIKDGDAFYIANDNGEEFEKTINAVTPELTPILGDVCSVERLQARNDALYIEADGLYEIGDRCFRLENVRMTQVSNSVQDYDDCLLVLQGTNPVLAGEVRKGYDYRIHIDPFTIFFRDNIKGTQLGIRFGTVMLVDSDGNDVVNLTIYNTYFPGVDVNYTPKKDTDLFLRIMVEDLYTLQGESVPFGQFGHIYYSFETEVTVRETELTYSDVFRVPNKADGFVRVKYFCDKEEFGIPFKMTQRHPPRPATKAYVIQTLPIIVRHPQPTQDDKVYTTLSGRNIVLYSEVGKEYECETDYIPEEWHDKLAIALACDEVYMDGKLLTKTDKYKINWEEKDVTECGLELAKATFKMKENIVKRNSNY